MDLSDIARAALPAGLISLGPLLLGVATFGATVGLAFRGPTTRVGALGATAVAGARGVTGACRAAGACRGGAAGRATGADREGGAAGRAAGAGCAAGADLAAGTDFFGGSCAFAMDCNATAMTTSIPAKPVPILVLVMTYPPVSTRSARRLIVAPHRATMS
jgi:hypothetical protein